MRCRPGRVTAHFADMIGIILPDAKDPADREARVAAGYGDSDGFDAGQLHGGAFAMAG